jgi:hypothetical protein
VASIARGIDEKYNQNFNWKSRMSIHGRRYIKLDLNEVWCQGVG